jgi:hypothetical protein
MKQLLGKIKTKIHMILKMIYYCVEVTDPIRAV